jgi:hypothetical protein
MADKLKAAIFITAGQRPEKQETHRRRCLKRQNIPAFANFQNL